MKECVDVVVVGAGPVGLLLAIELRLAGATVCLLERLRSPSGLIKALGLGPLGVEALQRRGMAGALAAEEARAMAAMATAGSRLPPDWGARMAKSSGHFAFLPIPASAQAEPGRRMRLVEQQSLEAMLGARAAALGIEARRGCELEGFEQGVDGVDVEWSTPGGGGRIRCAYLVGCDGGRSTVRKRGGFAFPGTEPTLTMVHAACDLDDPAGRLPGGWHRTERGVYAVGPFPRRLFLIDFSGPPADRQAPVTREEVEAVLRRISGVDVGVRALEQANRWTDQTRLVDDYRRGRVLLAGDAAHIHSPFGGQGLSLGLSDAANLGWKLAAVARGARDEAFLDTYAAERRPVAEAVLANTLAQLAAMRPDPQSGALRELLAGLMRFDDVARHFGGMIRGVATRYELGSPRDEVGRLVADRPLGGTTLYEAMADGAAILLDAGRDGEASRLVGATAAARRIAIEDGPSMLIRPDGCVAWAGDDLDGLEAALRRWLAPAPRTAAQVAAVQIATAQTTAAQVATAQAATSAARAGAASPAS